MDIEKTTALQTAMTDATSVDLLAGQSLYEAFIAGRSANTRDAYARDLAKFASFVAEPSATVALTKLLDLPHGQANGVVFAYRSHLSGQGLASATINRRLSAIRSAAKLGRTFGLTGWVPEIDGLKCQSYRDTVGPGLEGTRAMLASAKLQHPIVAARDAAIIRLLFDLALRRGEIVSLDLKDIDHAGRRLWILGKGRSQKEATTLPENTASALKDWIELRSTIAPADQVALFVSLDRHSKGRRITGRGIHYVISQLGNDIGITTRPHGLRHASITTALDTSNGDVRAVQIYARHARPETTIRYDDSRSDLAGHIAKKNAAALL